MIILMNFSSVKKLPNDHKNRRIPIQNKKRQVICKGAILVEPSLRIGVN